MSLQTQRQAVTFTYPVNTIYPSIQGEGCMTGVPMVILRLQGCDVGCPFCDTRETWELDGSLRVASIDEALAEPGLWTNASGERIAAFVSAKYPGIEWVLLTGGEPAIHPLRPVVNALHRSGYKVAIETSGTEVGHVGAGLDWICVSPKIAMPGGKAVHPLAVQDANEIKFVVGKRADIAKLDRMLASVDLADDCVICLQPISQGERATELCRTTVMERRGYRLSVQVHKYLRLP